MQRTALVTGGGRGIGQAIARQLASEGARVAIAARTQAQLDATAGAIRARGGECLVLPMDVADERSIVHGIALLARSWPQVDILVNNAGVGGGLPITARGEADQRWQHTIDVNLVGMYRVTRECLALMPDGARIINMSSVLGRFGVAGYTAYCAAKHGVLGFTRALALELAPRRITVNAVCPGWVDTEMAAHGMQNGAHATGVTFEEFRRQALDAVPLKRIIEPAEVAALTVFLASPQASAITGQTYNICGGQTMD
ncbi:MAG: SDR family NAD(P)-dependent oxidoreductase [Planctomycetota bacterium]